MNKDTDKQKYKMYGYNEGFSKIPREIIEVFDGMIVPISNEDAKNYTPILKGEEK